MARLQGADLSHWNDTSNFAGAKGAGMAWLSVKASQGNTIDPLWAHHAHAARDAGLPIMPYCFLWPGGASADEHFATFARAVDLVGGWEGFLAPALDVEGDEHCNIPGETSASYCAKASRWLDLLKAETGAVGTVYTFGSFSEEHGVGRTVGSKSRLWAVHLGKANTTPFPGWDHVTFQQYDQTAAWVGLGNGLDLDYFFGTAEELAALKIGAKQKPMIVGADGHEVKCEADWSGARVTVKAALLLTALGVPLANIPAGVIHDNGRAFIAGPDGLGPHCQPWVFAYRTMAQGPRVYVKRVR